MYIVPNSVLFDPLVLFLIGDHTSRSSSYSKDGRELEGIVNV